MSSLSTRKSDAHVWAQTYDRKLIDIFAVEAEIATSVAETLQAKLTGPAKRLLCFTPDREPGSASVLPSGNVLQRPRHRGRLPQGDRILQRRHPTRPAVCAGLDRTCDRVDESCEEISYGDKAQEAYAKARAAAETALALAPNLAAAHTCARLCS